MKIDKKWLAGVVTVLATATGVTTNLVNAQSRQDFSGVYTASGVNPDGSKYSGLTVAIVPFGDGYKVTWSDGSDVVKGAGTDVDDVLAVGYQADGANAVAVYHIKNANTLEGYWQTDGEPKEGSETLVRR